MISLRRVYPAQGGHSVSPRGNSITCFHGQTPHGPLLPHFSQRQDVNIQDTLQGWADPWRPLLSGTELYTYVGFLRVLLTALDSLQPRGRYTRSLHGPQLCISAEAPLPGKLFPDPPGPQQHTALPSSGTHFAVWNDTAIAVII